MSLEEFRASYLQDGEPIVSVEAGLVYFVHDGRNAWHNTWVQRYEKGCISQYQEDAKEYCEEKRKSGSVFYISELPAIVLQFHYGKMYVVQINADVPFKGYMERAGDLEDGAQPGRRIFSTINDFMSSIDIASGDWDPVPSSAERVFCLWTFDPHSAVVSIPPRPLEKVKSKSYGVGYYLCWNKVGESANPLRTVEIAKDISDGLEISNSSVQSIFSFRNSRSKQDCPRVDAVTRWAYTRCGELTKSYRQYVTLLEVRKVSEFIYDVVLVTKIFDVKRIVYQLITDESADVVSVEFISMGALTEGMKG